MSKFKRKTKSRSSAILTSDWHIRESTPMCRTDNFWDAQEKKIDFIFDLARKNKCPIIIAGDIGHKPRWSCKLLEWFISKIDKDIKIIVIAGQHDLINHRLDLWEHSGVGVLHAAKTINFIQEPTWADGFKIYPFAYGQEIIKPDKNDLISIAMTHQMIIENKPLWPGQEAPKGNALLKKYACYNLILSGDNHNPFTCEYQGRRLVNPGSLMRTSADQINHKPRVYLWFAESNDIEAIYLPIKDNVISRTHIEVAKDRENRNEAFITRCNNMEDLEINYEDNLASYFKQFKTQIPVKNKVMAAVE